MSSKKSRRASVRLHSATFEIKPLEQRVLMSSGQLFVGNAGSVGEYTGTGTAVNAALISPVSNATAIAVSGSDLFVVNGGNTVSEYTTAGVLVNASLLSLPEVDGMAISGSHIYVSDASTGEIGEYTTAGAPVNASLISDSNHPHALAISGSSLFVVDTATNSIGEYTLSGQTVTAALVGTGGAPTGIAVSGSDIFVADGVAGTVAEDTTAGVSVNAALISGLTSPQGISVYGSTLYVADAGTSDIGQYTTAGATVNAALISGLSSPLSVFPVGPGSQLVIDSAPATATAGSALTPAVTVSVVDANGNVDSLETSSVVAAIATGPTGGVLGGATTIALQAGVATFSNLTLSKTGSYTLHLTDGSFAAATTGSITVQAGAAAKLVFSQPPTAATTGVAISPPVTVDVEDANNNLVTTDGSTVVMSIATGPVGAVLGGTTSVVASGGVATFSTLTLSAASGYTLTASDGGYTPATSASFTITAPGVDRLAFAQQPASTTTASVLAPVKVNIQNSAGVLQSSDTSTVTLAIATGPAGATLGGTTIVAAAGGVATFSTLSFAVAGDYTLIATDGTDSAATSLSFTISSPMANKLAFATQPASATPTTGLGTIKIDVENHAGTLLSGDHSDVTLSIATGTSGATLGGTTTVAAVNGVATFSDLFITTAGTNYTLTASDGTDAPATSAAFNIVAPPPTPGANSLVFVAEPVNTNIAATLGSITVDIKDSSGALVTTDSANVTLSVTGNPAGVVLGGTTTVAAVNGVATFSNVTIAQVGSYTLTATQTGDTPATSTLFNVYYPPVTVGQLDPAFGSAGLVKSNVGFTTTAGVASDGSQVVVIGTTGAVPTESFSVARYNANGTLDTAFGTSGAATIHFAGTDDVPSAVAVLAGGQILIAGTATTYVAGAPTTSQFAIAELNANGTPDTSFGNGTGEVQFGFSTAATHDVLTSMVVSPSGVIYLGGRSDSRSTTGNDFAIIALDPAGTPHASFGAGGQVLIDFDNGSDTINSLALQSNGDLVAAGSAMVGGVTEIALARVLPTGVLDRRFGTNGEVTTSVRGIFDSATSVAIQPKGQIVIGGLSAAVTADTSTTDFVVARYTSGGRLDRSFGGGAVVTSFSGPSAVTQVMIQADGRIVATGKIAPSLTDIVSNQLEVALARYTTRGVLDAAFDGSGTTAVDLTAATYTTTETLAATPQPVSAATLATDADLLIASKQGSAVLNAASEILAVGNTGANTVEAEVITHGVDLSAALLSQLPAAIAGGTKSFANVQITENAADIAKGSVTIVLEITTDAQGNGPTVVKTLVEKINLAGGRSHTYKIPFIYPADLPTGSYYLLADVVGDGTPAMRELNQLNNLSPASHTVAITPPFVSLTGSALSATSSFTSGKLARIEFTLTNNGNVLAKGRTVVDLYLSTDQTVNNGTLVSSKPFALALQPGASHVYRQSFVVPNSLASGTYTLIAVVDPLKSLGSTDQTSSTVIDPTRLTIG